MVRSIALAVTLVALMLGGSAFCPAPAAAQTERNDDFQWSAHAAGGFTLSPSAFLLTTGLEYQVAPELEFGPLLQFAFDNDDFIFASTANVRYHFDLSNANDQALRYLEPFIQGGLGLVHIDKDRRGRDRDDTEFMLNGGFGVDYWIDPRFSVGTAVLFNGMPAGQAAGERFFFSWQLLTARFRF